MPVAQFIRGSTGANAEAEAAGPIVAPPLETIRLALRLDDDSLDGEVTRLAAVAVEQANRQLRGAAVPPAVSDQAVIMFVGWAFESPLEIGASAAGSWRRCGAASMLRPWTPRRAGAIG